MRKLADAAEKGKDAEEAAFPQRSFWGCGKQPYHCHRCLADEALSATAGKKVERYLRFKYPFEGIIIVR